MTLDASGNLLVGNTAGSGLNERLNITGNGIAIEATDAGSRLILGNYGGSDGIVGMFTNDNLQFRTNNTERMRITSGGEVLIGSTGIYGGGSANESDLLVVGAPPSNDVDRGLVSFLDNRAYNTSGLGAKLMLGGSFNSSGSITFFSGLAGLKENTTDGNYAGALAFYTRANGGASSEKMRITSGGNVGIGTSSLDGGTQFQLFSSSSPQNLASFYTALNVSGSSGTNSAASPAIYMSGDSNTGFFSPSGDNIGFSTNGSERMRITSGGELLINTTSDAGDYKLQVNGNTYTNGSLTTAAPSGGTAKPWKLGEAGVSIGGSNLTAVKVEIDGVVYYLVTGYLPEPEPDPAALPSSGPSASYKTYNKPIPVKTTKDVEIENLKKELEELKQLIKNK
jgi:hypothetical protein